MGDNPGLIRYRRCHVCGAVTESFVKIESCGSCGKSVAPFFYFDDLSASVPSDAKGYDFRQVKGYRPLVGLTAYWTGHGSR